MAEIICEICDEVESAEHVGHVFTRHKILGLCKLQLTQNEADELDRIAARPSPLIGMTLRRANRVASPLPSAELQTKGNAND